MDKDSCGELIPEKMEKLNFEEAMEKLEKLVGELEKGELPLEESLNCFRKAISLSRHCRAILAEAEYQVQYLLKEEGWTEAQEGIVENYVENEEENQEENQD